MLSGEPWTIGMFDHFRCYILAKVKDSAVLDPENEAPTFQKAKFEETGNWNGWNMKMAKGFSNCEINVGCSLTPKQRSCFDMIGNQICLRWSVKHCLVQGMQQCLRKGLGVFAQNASNLVGDSVMTSVRCFGDVNAMQRLSLPRLHYIEFLMKQKKVTRARRALDRVCSLALPIGVFCVQLR